MNIGRFRQSHTALASTFGSLIMGMINAWPSYTSELYLSETNTPLSTTMTQGEEALMGSLPSLGAIIGSGVVGTVINKLGRRNGGIVVTLPVLVSWIIISFTTSIKFVLAARLLVGITGGAALVLAPVFISEVAEDSIRGTLASAPMFMYSAGAIFSYVLGWCMTYYTIVWINLSLSITAVVLLALVTESPMYLLRQDREEDAKLSIAKYRGVPVSSTVVLDELAKMKQQLKPSVELVSVTEVDTKADEAAKEKPNQYDVEPEKPPTTSAVKLLFLEPASRRAFIVVTTVISLPVLMGLMPVQVYAKTVFKQTDPSMADMYTILFAVVMFAGACVTVVITDKAGRKVLFITSSVLVFLTMTALGYFLQTKSAPPIVTVILIFAFSFSFMFGAGSIPFVLLAEAFIPEVQNLASMIVIELLWLLAFFIIGIFPLMNNVFGIHGSFYFFGFIGLVTAIIAYFIVPETKGLSNAQIQDAFMPRKKN